jgi:glutamate racemase
VSHPCNTVPAVWVHRARCMGICGLSLFKKRPVFLVSRRIWIIIQVSSYFRAECLMNHKGVIGVFDSGVGGLSVWRELARQLPGETIIYLADQAHVPYGSRPPDEIRAFAEGITRFLLERDARAVVIASNTISAAALYPLRRQFPGVPFVGMEPALKPATAQTHNGVVGVMATPNTFQGEPFARLVERFGGNARVVTQVCPGLVEAVERGDLESPAVEALLRQYVTPLIEAGTDQLVLGCTHYPFLRPTIERLAGANVTVIDPAAAVARQTARVLAGIAPEPPRPQIMPAGGQFYTTGDVAAFTRVTRQLLTPAEAATMAVRPAQWGGDRVSAVGV